jgi:hypothetical protein
VTSTKPKLHPKEMIFVADFGNESFSKKKQTNNYSRIFGSVDMNFFAGGSHIQWS